MVVPSGRRWLVAVLLTLGLVTSLGCPPAGGGPTDAGAGDDASTLATDATVGLSDAAVDAANRDVLAEAVAERESAVETREDELLIRWREL